VTSKKSSSETGTEIALVDKPTETKRNKGWAHLFDQDKERLIATAKWLGVRVIKVEREGKSLQHIDLCGKPLQRAKVECDVLLRDGAYVFTPVRGASEAMLAAAGFVTVHQPNVAKVVDVEKKEA